MPEYNGAMKKKETAPAPAEREQQQKLNEFPNGQRNARRRNVQSEGVRKGQQGKGNGRRGSCKGGLHKKLTFTLVQSQPIWPIATSVTASCCYCFYCCCCCLAFPCHFPISRISIFWQNSWNQFFSFPCCVSIILRTCLTTFCGLPCPKWNGN